MLDVTHNHTAAAQCPTCKAHETQFNITVDALHMIAHILNTPVDEKAEPFKMQRVKLAVDEALHKLSVNP